MFLLLLIIDVFFYGFGAAIRNLNHKEIEQRAQEEKDKRSVRLEKIMNSPDVYIDTVQLVVTLICLVMGAHYLGIWQEKIEIWMEYAVRNIFGADKIAGQMLEVPSAILAFAALTYILLTFGVLLPKKIATRMSEKWAYSCIGLVSFMTKLLRPLTGLVSMTANGILFLFGIRNQEKDSDVTEEEIINMVQEGHE